ncbi:MAG: diacylglycerol kinase [Deltaproteobacteria bacterium]|nr:diacylglycerol kinase [Deltaproteobacteria bacterium]
MHKGKAENRGLKRPLLATRYTMAGLKAAWKHEEAFRLELAAAALMVPSAFWLGQTAVERSLLIGSCLIVLITELLNSSIEAVVDRVGTEHHELSGRAKDLGSAAVFCSLVMTVFIWLMISVERFF